MRYTLRRSIPTMRLGLGNLSPVLVAWGTALVAMPVVQWGAGHNGLIAAVILGVLLTASLVLLFVAQVMGDGRGLRVALTVMVVAWLAELVGSRTGLPFGAYRYTEVLQPQPLGVPLLIPLAWLMILPPAWAVAHRLTGRHSGPAFVAVSALACCAWDLFLDPQMVHWGLWVWEPAGPYFGIPLTNFAGWLLVSALITALARPPALPGRPLLVIYTLIWLIETVGQVAFWRLYGPALWGCLGMGVFVLWAWRNEVAHLRQPEPAQAMPR